MSAKSQTQHRRQRLAAAAAAATDTSSLPPYSWKAQSERPPAASDSPSVSPASSSSNADSNSSYTSSSESRSTAPTTPRIRKTPPHIKIVQEKRRPDADLPPIVTNTTSSSSVNTYDSAFSDVEGEDLVDDDDDEYDDENDGGSLNRNLLLPPSEGDDIPPVLPPYRATVADPSVRPSTPHAFGKLFPSMDRLSVRHDDLTPDGNMNLRVDTVIPGPVSGSISGHNHYVRRRHSIGPVSLQLFHLRMHDLARRDFSLRRYCRDSGREVCSSKRAYVEAPSSPAARSVSTALRSVATPFRSSTNSHAHSGLFHRRPSTGSSTAGSTASSWDEHASRRRRGSVSTISTDRPALAPHPQMVPTETIKLEFSNYARVEVSRCGDKRYEFEWWGHSYAWRRVVDENLDGAVSFHLVRDGKGPAVAHIVPETRSPNQVVADEAAGGWIAPSHMWISDPSVVEAMTDVAE